MQTQSDPSAVGNRLSGDDKQPRSVFSNFKPDSQAKQTRDAEAASLSPARVEGQGAETLQTSIDTAVARSFIYRFAAKVFEDPTDSTWAALTHAPTQGALLLAVKVLAAKNLCTLEKTAVTLAASVSSSQLENFKAEYVATFGHAARGRCPLNEIEYGDIKADPLFQPHRLADLSAFYSAFGLEVANDAAERHDHICLELEFMSVLAAKEAYALEHQLDAEQLALCRNAQKVFLREHLGRWTPAFTRRLSKMVGEQSALGAIAAFTREFVVAECARFDVTAGSEDLLLRPVNQGDESLCDSCGIASRLPGALQTCGET